MSFSKIAGAAVLLALTPVALAGSAHVVNNCGFPVYYAYVGQSQHDTMQEMQGSFSAPFDADGNGISIKLSPSQSGGGVTQFETTKSGADIFYDMSNIDGNPFAANGMSLVPSSGSDSAHPSCVPVDCPAGAEVCTAAYNLPDDVRTNVCGAETDLTLTLCPGGSGSSSNPTPSSESSDSTESSAPAAPADSASAASPVAEEPATATAGNGNGWGKPPAKRAEHAHKRVHSRAFHV